MLDAKKPILSICLSCKDGLEKQIKKEEENGSQNSLWKILSKKKLEG